MKKLITLSLTLFLSLGALAQGEVVSKYFDRFADNEDYVKASISSKMFSLFTELEAGSDEEKEFLEENFHFAIKEKGGIISELIMVSGGKKGFAVLSLYGEIDLKNISKIARNMQVDGLSDLEKIDEGNGKKK